MIEIVDDEMLLSAGLLVSPGAGDAGVELQDQVPIVAHGMAASVESFADPETSAESARVGYTGQGGAVHDGHWEFDADDGSSSILWELD